MPTSNKNNNTVYKNKHIQKHGIRNNQIRDTFVD